MSVRHTYLYSIYPFFKSFIVVDLFTCLICGGGFHQNDNELDVESKSTTATAATAETATTPMRTLKI